jgi:cell division protein FtsZ
VRGITDLMIMPGLINHDFADIRTVMSEMGKAMMGTGEASGERRAIEAAEKAIANPLLDEVSMRGAKGVIINITGGDDLRLHEVDEAATHIREMVDPDANIIVGSAFNSDMNGMMRVSVVATGIDVIPRASAVAPQRPSGFNRPGAMFDGPAVAVPGRAAPAPEPAPVPVATVPEVEAMPLAVAAPEPSDELDLAQAELIEDLEPQPAFAQFTPKNAPPAPVVPIRAPEPAPVVEEPEAEPQSLFQKMLNLSRGTKPVPPRAPTTLAPDPERQPEAGTDVEIPPFFRRQVNE